jgi:hypothetical protein
VEEIVGLRVEGLRFRGGGLGVRRLGLKARWRIRRFRD